MNKVSLPFEAKLIKKLEYKYILGLVIEYKCAMYKSDENFINE